jgi:AraC-like DNA-binding protein
MIELSIELFYFIRALIVLIEHQGNIKQEFSYQAKINLSWLKLITFLYIVVLVSNVIGFTLVSSKILNIKVMDDLLMIVRFLLFFYMVYHAYNQKLVYRPEINSRLRRNNKSSKLKLEQSKKEEDRSPEVESNETIEKLRKIMVNEKLYLERELSLGETANKLGIHAHHLSKLLNVQLGVNFFEFVNEYRVDEFKRLASNPENKHISLLGLAMDAGFNSKATFNRFFKISTGLTPSDFRESYQF